MKIYITGLGCVSALGMDVGQNLEALKMNKTGISSDSEFYPGKTIFTGKIAVSNAHLSMKSGPPMSRTSLLAIAAAGEAWQGNKPVSTLRDAFIHATSVGGMDRTEKFYSQYFHSKSGDFDLVRTHDSGNTGEKIAAFLGFKHYINTLSTACSSSANALMLGARMIRAGKADRVLAGGADPLTTFTIKGFHSLMIYDVEWCKPFDHHRNGLNLGEGAAFLLLESEKSLQETGNKPLALLTGWCNAADAFHQTASSPDGKGATLAMQGALTRSKLNPNQIDYINAHGTGTKNNDLSESMALKNIFGEKIPPFSSTKAYTGHTLAAAGAIEAVFSVLAIRNSFFPSNLNFSVPLDETQLQPVSEVTFGKPIKHVLSNSFGFGGNNSSLIFSALST